MSRLSPEKLAELRRLLGPQLEPLDEDALWHIASLVPRLLAERDRLAGEVERLTKERDAARLDLGAMNRMIDETLAVVARQRDTAQAKVAELERRLSEEQYAHRCTLEQRSETYGRLVAERDALQRRIETALEHLKQGVPGREAAVGALEGGT